MISNYQTDLGDLRTMMEEVAEKAAKQAAQTVSNEVQLEMLRMERRIRAEIIADTKALFQEFLGMKPSEHAIEHRDMHDLNEKWKEFQAAIVKKVIGTVMAGALLVALAGSGIHSLIKTKPVDQFITPRDHRDNNRGGNNDPSG